MLSITLNNKKSYNITVKKNCRPKKYADSFCYEHGLGPEIKQDLINLLSKYLTEYKAKGKVQTEQEPAPVVSTKQPLSKNK